jgi:hypothetical protein
MNTRDARRQKMAQFVSDWADNYANEIVEAVSSKTRALPLEDYVDCLEIIEERLGESRQCAREEIMKRDG